ncbi:MAG: hypothetical protein DRI84_07470 [Bacteroidetes bacterium]|nr:MAG: hypothetical protein DRI84_07470 [Bacteroidota bacterium]
MKKFFKSLVISLAMLGLVAGTSFAGSDWNTYDDTPVNGIANASGYLSNGSPWRNNISGGEDWTSNSGAAGYTADVFATGNKEASISADGSAATGTRGFAFGFNLPRFFGGGELSFSANKTTGFSEVEGSAYGKDHKWYKGFDDTAYVGLTVSGDVRQGNGTYSNDKGTWAAAGNSSRTMWFASDSDYSAGWFSSKARANESLAASGEVSGWTESFAKQTGNFAIAQSVTFSTGSAQLENQSYSCWGWSRGPVLDITVMGAGGVSGNAYLPSAGNAGYTADYTFTGGNNAYGTAGGIATVKTSGYSVTSSVSAFAKVGQNN